MGGRWYLLLIASVVSISIAEIGVRLIFRYNTPSTVNSSSIRYEPSLFSRHLMSGGQVVDLDSGWGIRHPDSWAKRVVRINRHGLRGEEVSLEKPEGVERIVVMGGSAVFDLMATTGEDWPHLAQRDLRESGLTQVEVLNAGVPGHASFDSLGRLYSQIWVFEPDYVVLNNAWNDIKHFTRLSREQPLGQIYKPYVEDDDPFRTYTGTIDRILCKSQLYVKIRTQYYLSKLKVGNEGILPHDDLSQELSDIAKIQYENTVRTFVHAARVFGIEPILMTQPTLVHEESSESEKSKINYEFQGLDHKTLVEAFDYCNSAVREIASEMNVILLDADSHLSGKSELFVDHVHTTNLGSVKLAELLAATLRKELEDRNESGTNHLYTPGDTTEQ